MNIPNILTVLRVLLIPIIILLFYLPFQWSYLAASAVFAIAAITDWLDGYLARKLQQSTPFGAFLDPVADKLMVAVALVLLVEEHSNLWLTLPAAIIIGREIVVSALREWMAELGARAQVAVSNLGKWKTAAQMVADKYDDDGDEKFTGEQVNKNTMETKDKKTVKEAITMTADSPEEAGMLMQILKMAGVKPVDAKMMGMEPEHGSKMDPGE